LDEKNGFGAIILNDKTGPRKRTGIQLSFAHHLQVNEGAKLSFGLAGMMYQHVLDMNKLTPLEPGDNALKGGKEKSVAPDFAFGVYYYADKYYAGFSINQLFQTKTHFFKSVMFQTKTHFFKSVRHYFLTGGYKFEINEDIDIEPSVLIKAVAKAPTQLDINAKAFYKDLYWLGLSFRGKESIVTMLGVIAKNKYIIGYSLDITLTQIRKYSTGSHEIYFAIKFPAFRKKAVL